MIYFSGRNNGVAEELSLKANEITRKKSDYLEGTYAVHGIEEVMDKNDIVFVVDPIDEEVSKFQEVLEKGVGLKVVAIDMNENGKADPDEICETRARAVAAIAAGRYPATRKNYFFIRKNAAPLTGEFIRFVLSEEGARIVDEVGASLPLLPAERDKILKELP